MWQHAFRLLILYSLFLLAFNWLLCHCSKDNTRVSTIIAISPTLNDILLILLTITKRENKLSQPALIEQMKKLTFYIDLS